MICREEGGGRGEEGGGRGEEGGAGSMRGREGGLVAMRCPQTEALACGSMVVLKCRLESDDVFRYTKCLSKMACNVNNFI
jgi:hypothetical protein